MNDSRFEIAGHFGSLEDALSAARPYPMTLSFALPGLTAELTGTAANLPRAEGLALDLSLDSPSLGELLEVWGAERAMEGRATLTARLAGDLESLAVPELSADLEGGAGQRLHAEGALGDLLGAGDLDLRFDGRLVPGSGLLGALPTALRDLDAIDLKGRASGDLTRPVIEAFAARATHGSGAKARLEGDAAFDFTDDQPLVSALTVSADFSVPDVTLLDELAGTALPDVGRLTATLEATLDRQRLVRASLVAQLPDRGGLEVRADGPLGALSDRGLEVALDPRLALSLSTETIKPLLTLADESFPDVGPLSATGELSRQDGAYRLESLRATLGRPGQVQLAFEGSLAPIGLRAGGDEPRLAGKMQVEWPSSQALAPYLGREIVELGPATGSFALAGGFAALSLTEIAVETRSADGLRLRAHSGVAKLGLADGVQIEEAAIALSAEAPTTEAVAVLFGWALPELGPLRADGRLTFTGDRFALAGLRGSVGPEGAPLVQATGEVGDLATLAGVSLEGSYRIPASVLLEELALAADDPLGFVGGAFELSDADGSLGFERFTAELVETDLAALSLSGGFDDVSRVDELDVQASLDVPDLAALGKTFGLSGLFSSPLTFEGRLKGSNEAFALDGQTRVGETVLPGKVSGSWTGPRPSFRAELSSPVFYFADFGLTPEVVATTESIKKTPETAGPRRLFGDTPLGFDALRSFDLTLDVQLDELDGVSLDVDSAVLKAELTDGLLTVEPLQFNFIGSSVVMRFSIDARAPQAKVRFFATMDDLDLGDLFGQLRADVPIDGELDMIANVQAEGDTPHALASSLFGEVDLAIERGHIRSRAFAFTALDLSSWLFAKSTRRGYSKLNCFVVRFEVADGLAETKTLFLDTDNVQVFGDGDIALGPETIHMDMDPQPKTRRIAELTTSFSIDGPLTNPTVHVNTGGAAMRTLGEIVLTPINLLGRLLPFVNDRGGDENNPCVTVQIAGPVEAAP